jgi:hypothetical protein
MVIHTRASAYKLAHTNACVYAEEPRYIFTSYTRGAGSHEKCERSCLGKGRMGAGRHACNRARVGLAIR